MRGISPSDPRAREPRAQQAEDQDTLARVCPNLTTEPSSGVRLALSLTPHGRLVLAVQDEAPGLDPQLASRLSAAFARGNGHGLLRLGAAEVGRVLPPVFTYFRDLGTRFVTALCTRPDADGQGVELPPPPRNDLEAMALAAPIMSGAEYLTADLLGDLWTAIGEAVLVEHKQSGLSLSDFLKRISPVWNVVGRVHFHLAENRKDEQTPFAFLATYTHRVSSHGKAQHLPLGHALREYAEAAEKEKLLSLLLPVKRAAESCAWLKELADSGEIFHPLRWSPQQAFRFLGDSENLERAGVVVRMPALWQTGRPPRPQVTGVVGTKTPAQLGTTALLDFQMEVLLDGQALTPAEVNQLLRSTHGLALLRGQWVEVDPERLKHMLARFQKAEHLAKDGSLSFAEALRMLAKADIKKDSAALMDADWSAVVAGPWLAETLKGLRTPDELGKLDLGSALHGTLRPYQQVGVRWLHLLAKLGLGACLADDMGLGKTIQVLSLLLVIRRAQRDTRRPSLLVAPASLLANWAAEIRRFAPDLRALIAHTSALTSEELKSIDPARLEGLDVVITSYGSLLRIPWLATTRWDLAVLDEAQAIKNPDAKQTRAAKSLQATARIALTGTPIENHLGDLWSIFDFLNPGLLGSAQEFTSYSKRLTDKPHNPYGPLRDLVRPYILRRLKTDRSVISDLPDKTEVKAYCPLSVKQATLYQQAVEELRAQLAKAEGIQRRGLVLAFLLRLKQLCNHPSQWLADDGWAEADSGKWTRLRELAEVLSAKQEKALVFTQFREITAPLAAFLGSVFGSPGLVLHGGTDVKKRKELVERFQQDASVPFFVLSLKAGGSGLNLTAASHVIHVDRWWNPAVENQATDRAFRIGQKKNVLVHKFVCRGTVEEKIDELIESKHQLTRELFEGGAELNLTELSDTELLKLVALDLKSAMKE